MYFAHPWGLLGLLAIPTILAIHLFHQRFPPLVVAGLHLWGTESEVHSAGRRRDRLPITLTLILELLAALLLTMLIAQPRLGSIGTVTHLVVVLDDSASMSAKPDGELSFRDQAVQELESRIQELERGSVVTLILTGRRPVRLAGPAVSWSEASKALEEWQPQAPHHSFQSAWDHATQLAGETGELLFLTNRMPRREELIPQGMQIVSVGEPLKNFAITTARWNLNPKSDQSRLFLRISNFSRSTSGVTIIGESGDELLFKESTSIPGNSTIPFETELKNGIGELQVKLLADQDGMKLDNTVSLLEPQPRTVRVALLLPEEHTALSHIKRALNAVPHVELVDAANAHLIIAPAVPLPDSRPDLWWLGIGPIDPSDQAREQAANLSEKNRYLMEKNDPLLQDIVLGGIVWGGVQPTTLPLTPLISVGKSVLLGQVNGTRSTAYVLNIDMSRSNLPDSPDWPILMQNLIELRRENLPGLRRWNYRGGEQVRFRLYESPAEIDTNRELLLIHDEKERPLARTQIVELPPLTQTGRYSITLDEELVGELEVNFHDPEESDLSLLNSERLENEEEAEAPRFRLDNPYSWLIFSGILLLLVFVLYNWFILQSRQVVQR